MTPEAGLWVAIGGARRHSRDCLSMGWQPDADVPFHPGDEFPFDDRGIGFIACGDFIYDLDRAARLHFLLECRRTLRPNGRISITGRGDAGSVPGANLRRLAALAGLEPAPDGFTKPDRGVRDDPLVSILIPAYNPRFFVACLDSALAQTYSEIEIVICDDSPGPEIEAIVRGRASRFPVHYERNDTRLRPRGNFTRCFERAHGEFVKFLCDDDLLAPTCIASLLDAFRHAPDIALATSRRQCIAESGCAIGDLPATMPIVDKDTVIAGPTLANAMIMAGLNTIGEPSTVLFRKADLLDQAPKYFRFDGVAGHGIVDMVTWAALLLKGDAVYLHQALSCFRIHAGQRQRDPEKAQRNVDSIRALQAAWLDLRLHQRLQADVLWSKPFPPPRGLDWREQPVLGFAARPAVAG